MADAKEAFDDVGEMIKEFQKDPYGKFNDAKVAWLIKMWTRAYVALKGSSAYASLKIFFTRRGNPGKPSNKNPAISWRDELYADLVAYRKAMSFNKDNPDPAAFQAALDSMVGFVQDYRNQYTRDSKQDKAFMHQVTQAFAEEERRMAASK